MQGSSFHRARCAQGREFLDNLLKDGNEPWCKWLDPSTDGGRSWVQLSFKKPSSLFCMQGHPLTVMALGGENPSYPARGFTSFRCDLCGANGRTEARPHCNSCSFDFCSDCVTRRTATEQGGIRVGGACVRPRVSGAAVSV